MRIANEFKIAKELIKTESGLAKYGIHGGCKCTACLLFPVDLTESSPKKPGMPFVGGGKVGGRAGCEDLGLSVGRQGGRAPPALPLTAPGRPSTAGAASHLTTTPNLTAATCVSAEKEVFRGNCLLGAALEKASLRMKTAGTWPCYES